MATSPDGLRYSGVQPDSHDALLGVSNKRKILSAKASLRKRVKTGDADDDVMIWVSKKAVEALYAKISLEDKRNRKMSTSIRRVIEGILNK